MTDKAKLIQLIHIAKSQLAMDDFSYREMLKRLAGKGSSTQCTVPELHKVLHEMQGKGAKVKWYAPRRKKPNDYSPATGQIPGKSPITAKIRAVWITMGKHGFLKDNSEKALNHYARKLFKNRPITLLNIGALNNAEAGKLLEILKQWHKRLMLKAIETKGRTPSRNEYDYVLGYYNEFGKMSGLS